jgi:hypothetical protein
MSIYIIESENSSEHWPFFNTENQIVLDLGCGRWYTEDKEELSPFYFSRNSKLVIGVDNNSKDIEYYQQQTFGNSMFIFECINLDRVEKFRDLIQKYSVTAIKCDIEGNEFYMLDLTSEDLKNVQELAIEYHNKDLKRLLLHKMLEWGFTVKKFANFARTPETMGVLFCEKKIKL